MRVGAYDEVCSGVRHELSLLGLILPYPRGVHTPPVLIRSDEFSAHAACAVHKLGEVVAAVNSGGVDQTAL